MLLKAATPFDDHLLEVWLVSDAMQGRVRIVEYSQSGIGEEAAVGGGWEQRIMSSDPASTDVHGAMLGHVLRCVPFWMISTVLREGDDGPAPGYRSNGSGFRLVPQRSRRRADAFKRTISAGRIKDPG
ncbi:hypothetical protein PaG_01951 [Moesziomyces aphidis]|uniref:Uncharacterized protein n=1 Tax=Moesziomyces aphidis TaxID=84754 RepID=W3VQ06_MOEAP|nr:hypothetical protein PaG_01951 [Moesziomyces aphidis]